MAAGEERLSEINGGCHAGQWERKLRFTKIGRGGREGRLDLSWSATPPYIWWPCDEATTAAWWKSGRASTPKRVA